MLPLRRIPLGEWLPDRPPYDNPGAILIENAIPQAQSYRSLNGLEAIADVPDASNPVLGAYWARDEVQTVQVLAGTSDALYQLSGATWSDVSKSGGYSSVTNWEFTRFGTSVIAVAAGNAPQVIDLSAGSPQFADLAGSPPNASRVAIVRDHVVLGDLDTDQDTIQWSGLNNAEIWSDIRYEADSQRLYEGGKVQAVVSGPYGLVFQENAIRRMDYVGPPVIFSITPISRVRGTPAPNSVTAVGNQVYFYAQDGFFMTDGRQMVPVGEERVNRWFVENASLDDLDTMYGAVDRQNRLVVWAFKSSPSVTGNDRLLLYNYSVNRWSYAKVDTRFIAEARSVGYTLDGLDTPLPNGIDTDSISVDSDAYRGGALFLLAFAPDARAFSGAPLTATLDTIEFDGGQDRRMYINDIRPLIEGTELTTVSAALGGRETFTQTPVFSGFEEANRVGLCNVRSDNRYHRVRLQLTGGFKHAHGVDVFGRPSGRY